MDSLNLLKRMNKPVKEAQADAFCDALDLVLSKVESEIRLENGNVFIVSFHDLKDAGSYGVPFKKVNLKKKIAMETSKGNIDPLDFFKMAEAFIQIGEWMKTFEFKEEE